jgi:hypothetical protein
MSNSAYTGGLIRSRRVFRLTISTLVTAILVAGCGGNAPKPTSDIGRSTTPTPNTAADSGSTDSRPTTGDSAGDPGPLGFARCMRANGVSDFADPSSGGGQRFQVPVGDNPAAPAFEAAEAKCRELDALPAGPGSTTHPTARTLASLLKIGRCMRRHGVPQFPDPVNSVPSNPLSDDIREVTDYDGAILLFPGTIDMQAPAYRHALTACNAPPLGLPH